MMFDLQDEPKTIEEMANRYKAAARRMKMRDPTRPPPVVFTPKPQPKPKPEPVVVAQDVPLGLLPDRPDPLRPLPDMPDRVRNIIRDVAKRHNISVAFMMSRSRMQPAVRARQEAEWLLYVVGEGRWSTSLIGKWMGGRDHSTIIHSIKTASRWMGPVNGAW
jgi:hypothetical protein